MPREKNIEWSGTKGVRFMKEEEIRQYNINRLKGAMFTPRQQMIMDGTATKVRKNEVNILIQKCEAKGLESLAQEVYEQYEELITGNEKPEYTIAEAKKILQDLTPWEIDWGDD